MRQLTNVIFLNYFFDNLHILNEIDLLKLTRQNYLSTLNDLRHGTKFPRPKSQFIIPTKISCTTSENEPCHVTRPNKP